MVLLGDASLKFDVPQHLIFLEPSNPADGPMRDSVVSGEIVLELTRPKKVRQIDIELVRPSSCWKSRQIVNILGEREQSETLRRKLTINPFDEYGELQPGVHRFQWSFIVPANTAPFELCPHGRTSHFLRATAYKCSTWGGDVVAHSELDIVANSGQPGMVAEGFDQVQETYHSVLGPLRVHFFSKYMLRGGYLRMALSMPAVAQDVSIRNVEIVLEQNIHLQSSIQVDRTELVSMHISLWNLNKEQKESTPVLLVAGKELSLVRQTRLICLNATIRNTTHEFSQTGIKVSHSLALVIRFALLGSTEVRDLKIRFPAKLSSCACSLENLQLPGYALQDRMNGPSCKTIEDYRRECLCYRPTNSELEALYGVDTKVLDVEDRYGAERDRRPLWMDKSEDEQGNEMVNDLLRR